MIAGITASCGGNAAGRPTSAGIVMQNRLVRSEQLTRDAFIASDDGLNGLEPLAVPLGRMMSILRRNLWMVLLTAAIGVGGTAVVVTVMAKRYTAEASIVIEPQRTQVSDLQAISPDAGDVSSLVRTQIDILRSPALTIGVVKALHLSGTPEFAAHENMLLSGVRSRAEAILKLAGLAAAAPARRPTDDDAIQRAASALSGKISFANETRSSVLSIAATTHDPDLSARIANEVVRQFLDFKRQEKFAAMQRAHDWFQEQMVTLAAQVRADDLTVAHYRQEHGLDEESPNDGGMRPPTVNRQQLEAISRELVDVSRERTLKEGELTQAQLATHGHVSTNTLPAVIVSPVVGQLLAETAVAVGHEAELATTQGDRNPQLAAIRAQIQQLQRRTEHEMSSVAGSLSVEVNAARAQESSLQQRMDALRGAVSSESSAEVGLQALQTNARATRNIYESFLMRATQLANVSGIQEPDASLVASARPPLSPSAPQSGRLLAVASALSLALGVALACGIERLRTGFSLPEQLESGLGLQMLGLLPNVRGRIFRRPGRSRAAAAFSASLDRLRGQMRILGEERPRMVMVTSAMPKEGKSVFAAALARNMAAAGWRVLLLECDLCCPSLAAEFGLKPGAGLCDILSGKLLGKLDDVVSEPEPGLHVILAGSRASDSQELLASSRMSQLLAAVRANYDMVILDTPPVLPVADALILARHADATLMVVRWEKTARAAALEAVCLLQDSHAQILGAVMTRIDLRAAALSAGRMSYAFNRYDGYQAVRT